jgi:hypothetical protein
MGESWFYTSLHTHTKKLARPYLKNNARGLTPIIPVSLEAEIKRIKH